MVSKDIKIADETLRDGEQQPYINFSKDQKISLAKDIFNSGVDYIDARIK
jgi:isopropylmalate/homocitrate/citramalate synthase